MLTVLGVFGVGLITIWLAFWGAVSSGGALERSMPPPMVITPDAAPAPAPPVVAKRAEQLVLIVDIPALAEALRSRRDEVSLLLPEVGAGAPTMSVDVMLVEPGSNIEEVIRTLSEFSPVCGDFDDVGCRGLLFVDLRSSTNGH